MKKIFIAFGIIVAAIFGFVLYETRLTQTIDEFWDNAHGTYLINVANSQIYEYRLMHALKRDTYGGATPEETFNLFVEAIKKDDIGLAVKYVRIEKRGEAKIKIVDAKNIGQIEDLLLSSRDLEVTESSVSAYSDRAEPPFVFRMIINPFTNVWKIDTF
jgi:hypothetical protein